LFAVRGVYRGEIRDRTQKALWWGRGGGGGGGGAEDGGNSEDVIFPPTNTSTHNTTVFLTDCYLIFLHHVPWRHPCTAIRGSSLNSSGKACKLVEGTIPKSPWSAKRTQVWCKMKYISHWATEAMLGYIRLLNWPAEETEKLWSLPCTTCHPLHCGQHITHLIGPPWKEFCFFPVKESCWSKTELYVYSTLSGD